jgi:hypothetical protein
MKKHRKKKSTSMNKKATTLWFAVAIVILVISFAIFFFTSQKCTTFGGKREQQCVSDYMGLTEEQARQRAEYYNISVRVTDNNPRGHMNQPWYQDPQSILGLATELSPE